jgi:hypothetical protein
MPQLHHPWNIASLVLAFLLGAALVWAARRGRPKRRPLPADWALTARPVFGSEERRVYRQLREALPHHVVLVKLPIVRFCQPTDPREVRFWFELLNTSHVAFAICSPNGRVLAAIDLETDRPISRRSLQIKQSVLAACRVRYLRCATDELPSIPELQLLVPQPRPPVRATTAAASMVSQARESLTDTVAARRRERSTLWQDAGTLRAGDAMPSRRQGSLSDGFDEQHDGLAANDMRAPPDDIGGIVIDTPVSPLRH